MRVRRLGWAGIELEAEGESIVIDHLLDPGLLSAFLADDRDEFIAPAAASASAALVTHLHRDHTDVAAIERALGPKGIVLRPERKAVESRMDEMATGESDASFGAGPLEVRTCAPGDAHQIGPFAITALPASDGLGSPQVSWVVAAGEVTAVHCGDTLWHGAWWDAALAHGPIDLAFLPANGVEIAYPGWDPAASVPAVMGPTEAVEAARALRAGLLIPIHFNRTFEHPDYYRPQHDVEGRIRELALQREVPVRFLEPGDWIDAGDARDSAISA
ncbi:MAG: MBL fold metallo-hydrolase [Solirubrobacterales bacterium]